MGLSQPARQVVMGSCKGSAILHAHATSALMLGMHMYFNVSSFLSLFKLRRINILPLEFLLHH